MGGFVRKIIPKPQQPQWVEPQVSTPSAPKTIDTVLPSSEEDAMEQPIMRKRKGRASTILTTAQGLADNAPIGRKLLLGE